MNVKIKLLIIWIIPLIFCQFNLAGETLPETERTIYLMRSKQFYGSGAKMDLIINGKLFHKIKSGTRLIIKTSSNDTLSFQVVYPILKSYKSKVLKISLNDKTDAYVNLFYWGESYNPFKHAGVLNPIGGTPEFNIEIIEMTLDEGRKSFNNSEEYKDNNQIMIKRFQW